MQIRAGLSSPAATRSSVAIQDREANCMSGRMHPLAGERLGASCAIDASLLAIPFTGPSATRASAWSLAQ